MLRESLVAALVASDAVDIVGVAADGREAAEQAARTGADVVVVHDDCVDPTAVETIALVREKTGARVVLLADADDEALLVDALEAGAGGFLTTGSTVEDLVAAVRAVLHGELLVPSRMLGGLFARVARRQREEQVESRLVRLLTPREREVLVLLAGGANSQEIAETLDISPQTARTHLQKVMKKMGVHSRLQAAVIAVRAGLAPDTSPADRRVEPRPEEGSSESLLLAGLGGGG